VADDGPRPKLADLDAPLALRVRIVGGRIDAVRVDARRTLAAARVLEGRPVESALAALPALYRLCGTAQSVAGLRAVEAACGGGPGPAGRAARKLLVDSEALEQTLWRILLDWPRSVGAAADEGALKRFRKQLGAVRQWVFADVQWRRPGGVVVNVDAERLAGTVEAVAGEVAAILFGDVDPGDALRDRRHFENWIAAAPTATAAVLRWVASHDRSDFGAAGTRAGPEPDPACVAERLAADDDGAYCALPDLDGEVPQTGALARYSDAALLRELLAVHGTGLSTQLAARLFEVMALVAALRGQLRELAPEAAQPAPASEDGCGLGSVDTARGRLFHWVDVRAGRIARYRIVAPTEWNFHPRGPLARGLLGAGAKDAGGVRSAIALLVAAIDPCVGTELLVEEA
jgi:hypothetical protein